MQRELLLETHSFSPLSISPREQNSNGNMVVEGILATAEVKNGNGRYYPRNLWEREFQTYSELINERRAMGELDHNSESVINLKNVSHLIIEHWWEDNHIMGKVEILPTPSGKILAELIKANVSVGISSRGLGTIEQNGSVMEVQDDFSLVCFDFVSTPSNPGSYMHLVKEGIGNEVYMGNKYSKVNQIVTDIICSQTGVCSIC